MSDFNQKFLSGIFKLRLSIELLMINNFREEQFFRLQAENFGFRGMFSSLMFSTKNCKIKKNNFNEIAAIKNFQPKGIVKSFANLHSDHKIIVLLAKLSADLCVFN